MEQRSKAEPFRSLHIPGDPVVLFNIWDPGSAVAVARAGATAIATSSWSVAHSNGFPDGERMPLERALENLCRIVSVTKLPVTIDLESGYGDSADAVGKTVARAIEAGAVGCNLEDSFPSDGKLRTTGDQVGRTRQARRVADDSDIRLFINARTDVFLRDPRVQSDDALVAEAVERGRAYAEAGADGLFTPGLADVTWIARLAKQSPLPLNIMVGGGAPPIRALAELGVGRVSYGPVPYVRTMKVLEDAARAATG